MDEGKQKRVVAQSEMSKIQDTDFCLQNFYWIFDVASQWRLLVLLFLMFSGSRNGACGLQGVGNDKVAGREPSFLEPIPNVTVAVGRDASLPCIVDNLGHHKVAWIHLGREMIVSIHKDVVNRQPHYFVSHDGHKTWTLHITNVSQSDGGYYMCQINSKSMITQTGHLSVVVPPSIDDTRSSNSSLVVYERDNVTLTCRAKGFPNPHITWKREDDRPLQTPGGPVAQFAGQTLSLRPISRTHMGAYLCIASNGVPPSVSKRITLEVEFAPQMDIPNQLLAYPVGTQAVLQCFVEAYPRPVTYWLHNGVMVSNTSRIFIKTLESGYQIRMILSIAELMEKDFGLYSCIAKNSYAETNGSIQLNMIKSPSTTPPQEKFVWPVGLDDQKWKMKEDKTEKKEIGHKNVEFISMKSQDEKTKVEKERLKKKENERRAQEFEGRFQQPFPSGEASTFEGNQRLLKRISNSLKFLGMTLLLQKFYDSFWLD